MAAKRTVAIFSRYNASEKALCAMYLAGHILTKRYRHVVWITPDECVRRSRYSGFSYKWDSLILSLQAHETKIHDILQRHIKIKSNTLHACELGIFFDANEQMHSMLPKGAKSAVFIDPYAPDSREMERFARKCDFPFSTSPNFTKCIRHPRLRTNSLLCPFDSALQLMPRVKLVPGHEATLFYPAYGLSFMEKQALFQVADIVKECCPATKQVVGYYDTNDEPEPGMDSRTYDWKLQEYLKQTDWVIDLTPRPFMGLFPSLAGALGIQWSGFDLSPHTDEYSETRRHLIPYPKGGLTIANAEAIAGHIVRQLVTPFDDTDRNKGAWSYAERLKEFTRTINKVFGAKSR